MVSDEQGEHQRDILKTWGSGKSFREIMGRGCENESGKEWETTSAPCEKKDGFHNGKPPV